MSRTGTRVPGRRCARRRRMCFAGRPRIRQRSRHGPRRRGGTSSRAAARARHRAPEAREPRLGHRVGVLDGPGYRGVGDVRARGVRERELERLLALVMVVVEHRHRDRLRGLARREVERAGSRRVVVARRRRRVRGGVVHHHRSGCGMREADHEVERHARAFLHARVGHRDRRRALHRGRPRCRSCRGCVGAPACERHRHVAVARRLWTWTSRSTLLPSSSTRSSCSGTSTVFSDSPGANASVPRFAT